MNKRDFLVMVGATVREMRARVYGENRLNSNRLDGLSTVARGLHRFPRGSRGDLRRGVLAVLALAGFAGACVPPSVEDLSGDTGEVYLVTNFAEAIPAGDHVTMLRGPGEFTNFQVGDVFKNSAAPNSPLQYNWYVDWDTETPVVPLLNFGANFQYFACSSVFDPADPSGQYPDQRQVLVVASTSPLLEPENAYLSPLEDPEGVLAYLDWTIGFQGDNVCFTVTGP